MKKSRFTKTQIVAISKSTRRASRLKISAETMALARPRFYAWKAKFGGMEVSDVAKMRALDDENRRLKRIVADQALNIDVLKMAASGKY